MLVLLFLMLVCFKMISSHQFAHVVFMVRIVALNAHAQTEKPVTT